MSNTKPLFDFIKFKIRRSQINIFSTRKLIKRRNPACLLHKYEFLLRPLSDLGAITYLAVASTFEYVTSYEQKENK